MLMAPIEKLPVDDRAHGIGISICLELGQIPSQGPTMTIPINELNVAYGCDILAICWKVPATHWWWVCDGCHHNATEQYAICFVSKASGEE